MDWVWVNICKNGNFLTFRVILLVSPLYYIIQAYKCTVFKICYLPNDKRSLLQARRARRVQHHSTRKGPYGFVSFRQLICTIGNPFTHSLWANRLWERRLWFDVDRGWLFSWRHRWGNTSGFSTCRKFEGSNN